MGRFEFIEKIITSGNRIRVDFNNGMIYSLVQRGIKRGTNVLLRGSECNGYTVHTLFFDGIKKQVKAHQVIWVAKNGIPPDGLIIDHIDRDRKNNSIRNLRLVTPKENRKNSNRYYGRLSIEEQLRIVSLYEQGDNKMSELAEDFGISPSRAQQIIRGWQNKIRKEGIKAGGNAVVPPLILQLFKTIEKIEKDTCSFS